MGFDGRYPQFFAWRDKIYGYAMAFVLWGGGESYHARGCKYISYIMGVFLHHGYGRAHQVGGISDFRFQLMKTTITHPPTSC
jgi:hypothetical protein